MAQNDDAGRPPGSEPTPVPGPEPSGLPPVLPWVLDEPVSLTDRPRPPALPSRRAPEPVPLPRFGPTASEPAPAPGPGPAATPATGTATAQPRRGRQGAGPGRVRLKIEPTAALRDDQGELRLTPATVQGWVAAVVTHLLVLLLLAITVLGVPRRNEVTIETSLPAGDPRGSEFGTELTGGLGIDEPLAAPIEATPMPAVGLTATPDATPELTNPLTIPGRDEGQRSGIALTGTGQGGSGDGFGVAKFGLGGTENVNNVNVKVGNPQFTLIWDSPVDLDLHVLEPGGSHLFWQSRVGAQGGELDVDDQDGLGPENIFWGGGLDQGNGPPGEYKWYVHYYGATGGVAMPTKWKVRIKHNGRYDIHEGRFTSFGQRTKTYTFKLDPSELPPTTAAATPPPGAPKAPAPDARQTFDRPPGPERDSTGWILIHPEGGRFAARFPDEPFVDREAAEASFGPVDLHSYTVDRGEGGYTVSYTDVPATAKLSAEATLEGAVRSAVKQAKGTRKAMRSLTVAGHPAREVEIELPEAVVAGGGLARVRVVRAGDRLFAASVTGTAEFVRRPDTAKFLDGFTPEAALR